MNDSLAPGLRSIHAHLEAGEVGQAMHVLGELNDQLPALEELEEPGLGNAAAALHRKLAVFAAEERFSLLHAWTMPSEARSSVRVFIALPPTDAPPAVFALALGERPRRDSFAIAEIGGVKGLFCSAWELARAAEESGKLRRLRREVAELVERGIANAKFLDLLLQIMTADRPDDALRASATTSHARSMSRDLVIAAACLRHDWLRSVGEVILRDRIGRVGTGRSPSLGSFLRYAHGVAVRSRSERERDLLNAPIPTVWVASGLRRGSVPPVWLSHQGHLMRLAGTTGDTLLFKYPLMGDFEFSCDAQAGEQDAEEGGVAFGGLGYEASAAEQRLIVRDASGPSIETRPCRFVPHRPQAKYNRLALRSTERDMTFVVNRHPVWSDVLAGETSPWIGLRAAGDSTAVFRNVAIQGRPVIPREVRMSAGDSLRGWMPAGSRSGAWLARDGEIHGARNDEPAAAVASSSLRYVRPLESGDVIRYDFFYQPDKITVHPTFGRIALLIEPSGVRLRWLAGSDHDWTGLAPDNAVTEPLHRRGPKSLPLKQDDWNTASLALRDDTLSLTLNAVEIYSRKMEPGSDRTFGFYYDPSQTAARIRHVVLRGDWPQRLTAQQLTELANAQPDRSPVDRRALGALFADRHVRGAALEVVNRAASMPAAARYELLAEWVLPNDDHKTLRTAFDFTPTHPAPTVNQPEAADIGRKALGGELVSPALELVQLAEELDQLDALRWRVQEVAATSNIQKRSQACLLALIDLARRDFAAANRDLDQLETYLQQSGAVGFSTDWPETLLLGKGLRHAEIREAARDLGVYLLEELRAERVTGTDAWERYVSATAEQLERLQAAVADANIATATDIDIGLKYWVPVSYLTAKSRGEGFPNAQWQMSADQILKHSGHDEDYLFFRSPLAGDFEIEGDFGGFNWRDTQLMVAGRWLAPDFYHESYVTGGFGNEFPPVAINPRLPEMGDWIRMRAVVKSNTATTYLNGRRLREEALPAERDPWIAIRSPYYGFGGAKDVRITGTPTIPDQVRLCNRSDLGGWVSYYDEEVGGEDADWRYDGQAESGGIIGRRQADLPGSGLESLLRYQRPMMEDGTIEYEFYYAAGEAHVHPTLDRRAFVLDPGGVRMHWVTDGPHDRTGLDPFNLFDEPANRRGPGTLPLIADAWNRLRLDLSGDTVRLTLNDQLVYEGDLEPTNQRTFGLFHYADQTVARVRSIQWRGDWPRQLPPIAQQELAGVGADFLDERLPDLTAVFEHDFVRDGFPLYRFHVYDTGWEEHIEAKPDGLHMYRPGMLGNYRYVVSPRMHLHGDFDAIATFEQLVAAPNSRGKWGISLRSVLEDKKTTLCSIFRGMVRRPGQQDQHIAIAEFTQWAPDRSSRTWYPGKTSDEASYGKLRLARRGEVLYCFFAERDSPHYRHIHTETVGRDRGRYDGIRLQADAESAVDEPSATGVIWKHLIVRAEDITGLPTEPAETQDPSSP